MQVITLSQLFTLILLYYHLHLHQPKAVALPLNNRTEASPVHSHHSRLPANNETLPLMKPAQTKQNRKESIASTSSFYNNQEHTEQRRLTLHQNSSGSSSPVSNKIKESFRNGPLSTSGKSVGVDQIFNNATDGEDDDDDVDDDDQDQQLQSEDYMEIAKHTDSNQHKKENIPNRTDWNNLKATKNVSLTLGNTSTTNTESVPKLEPTKSPQPVSPESQVIVIEPSDSRGLNKSRDDYGDQNKNNTDKDRTGTNGKGIVGDDIRSRARNVTNPGSRSVPSSTGWPSELQYSGIAQHIGASNSSSTTRSKELDVASFHHRPSTGLTSTQKPIEAPMNYRPEMTTTRSPIQGKKPVTVSHNAAVINNDNNEEEEEEEEEDEDDDNQAESDEEDDSWIDYEITGSIPKVTGEKQPPSRGGQQLHPNHHLQYPKIQPPTGYHRPQQPLSIRNHSNVLLPTTSRASKPANNQLMSTTSVVSTLYDTRRPTTTQIENADQDVAETAWNHWINRVVEMYHQIERSIQLVVDSWKSSKTFESLADRPMILMLVLAAAVISLALVMMLIVHLIACRARWKTMRITYQHRNSDNEQGFN